MTDRDRDEGEKRRASKDVFRSLIEARTAKVRYGRATLTVERSGGALMSPIADALKAHREGELCADEVAWIFIKDRTTEHSPTFIWDQDDLMKLLPRVTEATVEPEIKAQTPAELVGELEAIEKRERKEWKKVRKQMKKALPGISNSLQSQFDPTNQLLDQFRTPALSQAVKAMQGPQIDTFSSLYSGFVKEVELSLRPLSKQVRDAMLPQINLKSLGIDAEAYESFVRAARLDLGKEIALGNQLVSQGDTWQPLFREIANAAREAKAPDVADAVEDSAEEVVEDEADIKGLISTLNELIAEQQRMIKAQEDLAAGQDETNEKLDELQAGSPFSRQLFLGLAINAIWALILYVLAIKGIYLPPPPPEGGK
jgi:hypothetical protein